MSAAPLEGISMKRQIALYLALAMVAASTPVDAQLRGILKKKAGEVIGGKKPEAPPPAAPAPTPTAVAAAPDAPAPAPTRSAEGAAAPSAAKTAGSPLEVSELPVRSSAVAVLRGRIDLRPNGDWAQLPAIHPAAVAAAYALGNAAQVALVETVGAAVKTLVMSPAFLAEHDAQIKSEYKAVDHGLKGVVGMEAAMKKNDFKAVEAIQARMVAALLVDRVQFMSAEQLKMESGMQLAEWKKNGVDPKRSDHAKLQKMLATMQPLEALSPTDEKFKRGYLVALSIDHDGSANADTIYAMAQRATQENEQAAYDEHNLKGQLKQQLTTFVTVASKVNFKASTVEKNKRTLFVNPADEQQGALWKACFRAGEGPTAAALKLARAWLAEL